MPDEIIIEREIGPLLSSALNQKEIQRDIILVEGLKGSGKTFLVKKHVKSRSHLWIDLKVDLKLAREIDLCSSLEDLNDLLGLRYNFIPSQNKCLVIDNAHLSKNLGSFAYDIKSKWLSQSTIFISFLPHNILDNIKPDYHSCVNRISVPPFSFSEFLIFSKENYLLNALKNWSLNKPFTNLLHKESLDIINKYLMVGGLASVLQAGRENAHSVSVFSQYLLTYSNDLINSSGFHNQEIIKDTLLKLAQSIGFQCKQTHIAPSSSSEYQQVPKLFTLIENTNLIRNIPIKTSHQISGKKIPPKKYFTDHGIRNYYAPLSGAVFSKQPNVAKNQKKELQGLLENFVLNELMSKNTAPPISWRQRMNGSEVSFLCKRQGKVIPIQVKADLKTSQKHFTSLLNCLNDLQLDEGILFNGDTGGVYEFGGKKILQLPIYCVFKI
ncbi:MAG: DUF4143 domain-containing protein [bacterium]